MTFSLVELCQGVAQGLIDCAVPTSLRYIFRLFFTWKFSTTYSLSLVFTVPELTLAAGKRVNMASYLLRLVGYGRRREALPKVPTDEVVPMHLFDDYDNVKCNMFWTFRFDDVLDPDMLGNSLSELFQMEGWRKLGGRLRLRVRIYAKHAPKIYSR